MKQLTDYVWQLKGRMPFPNAINTYLVGDVLIDAGARFDGKVILRELEGREVTALALTHSHPDHLGSSKLVCETRGIPYWVPELDVPAAENTDLIKQLQPNSAMGRLFNATMNGPGHPVDRALKEGDVVAGFEVLLVPGHSKGHVAYWRESDRVLILGDVLNNMDIYTGIPGLREPKKAVTPDPAENRRSIKRLGPLEPKLICFGHGAPLRDTKKFVDFCASVPA